MSIPMQRLSWIQIPYLQNCIWRAIQISFRFNKHLAYVHSLHRISSVFGFPACICTLPPTHKKTPQHIEKIIDCFYNCPKQLETYRVSLFLSTNHGLRTPHFIIFRNYSAKLFSVVLSNPNLGLNSIITFQNIFSLLSQKSGNYIIMLRNLNVYFRKPPESWLIKGFRNIFIVHYPAHNKGGSN